MNRSLTVLCVAILTAAVYAAEPQSKPARTALDRYAAARSKIDAEYQTKLANLNRNLAADLQAAIKAATKAGDLDEANAIKAVLEKLEVQTTPELNIQVLIDGNSELHIAAGSVYWVQGDGASKPGMHGGQNTPTIINGREWMPVWSKDAERGPDRSEPLRLQTAAAYTLVSATIDGQDASNRVTLKQSGEETVLSIPDPELGSREYSVRLRPSAR